MQRKNLLPESRNPVIKKQMIELVHPEFLKRKTLPHKPATVQKVKVTKKQPEIDQALTIQPKNILVKRQTSKRHFTGNRFHSCMSEPKSQQAINSEKSRADCQRLLDFSKTKILQSQGGNPTSSAF